MTYQPYRILGENNPSRWLITCDHAQNTVPGFVNGGDLGLPAADMARHIAFDIGAAGVVGFLSEFLQGPAILSNFSRLVIDPNRGEDDPTLVMKLYDGTIIPANRHAGADALRERLDRCYRPYHNAYAALAARIASPVILSIHSFTPQLRGRPPRPWQIGVLYADDARIARPLLARLRGETDLTVGDNEPYNGYFPGDAIDRQARPYNHPNILIEIRNDLISTPAGQRQWAQRLAPILTQVLADTGL